MILDYAETLPPRGGCWAGTWPSHSACIWDGNPQQFFQNDPNHGPKKQFLTSVRLTIAIFGLMNIQNLQPLAGPLSQPTSLRRIFLRCSAGRSPRPSPHRAKLTRGVVEILWAMNRIPLLMGFVGVEYEYTQKNTHIREAYQLTSRATSIMTWDRGIFNGSVWNEEQLGGGCSNPQS